MESGGATAAKDSSDIYALFSEGITDIVEYQNKRIAFGTNFRIPTFVWVILVLSSRISMFFMGLQFGITGRRSFPTQSRSDICARNSTYL